MADKSFTILHLAVNRPLVSDEIIVRSEAIRAPTAVRICAQVRLLMPLKVLTTILVSLSGRWAVGGDCAYFISDLVRTGRLQSGQV
jgi:hypothetical protein